MQIIVPDVDALAEHAVAAGAKLARPLRTSFTADRSGQFADPFGYTWIIATRKEEMSLEEMHRRFDAMMKQAEKKKSAVNPIPKGYRTVTPYMIAADGPALLEFAKQAFGAEETFRTVGSAGGLHGEVRIGDSMVMMGGGIPGREFHATPNTPCDPPLCPGLRCGLQAGPAGGRHVLSTSPKIRNTVSAPPA